MTNERQVFSLREGQWKDYRGDPVDMETGAKLVLNPACEYSRKRFVYRKAEVPEILFMSKVVKPGDGVLDVGANIGYWSTALSAQVGPLGRVYAFEPSPISLEYLRKNIAINDCGNVTVFPVGLSNEDKTGRFRLSKAHTGSSRLDDDRSKKDDSIEIKVVALDSIRGSLDLDKISFIKIDVEGGEVKILEGAKKLLSHISPIILLECNSSLYKESGVSLARFIAICDCLGYTPHKVPSLECLRDGRLSLQEFRLAPDSECRENLILTKTPIA